MEGALTMEIVVSFDFVRPFISLSLLGLIAFEGKFELQTLVRSGISGRAVIGCLRIPARI